MFWTPVKGSDNTTLVVTDCPNEVGKYGAEYKSVDGAVGPTGGAPGPALALSLTKPAFVENVGVMLTPARVMVLGPVTKSQLPKPA